MIHEKESRRYSSRYIMLDLFTIFSKGGIVLWCFQGTCQSFTLPVNELIRSVILQVSFKRGIRPFNLPATKFRTCCSLVVSIILINFVVLKEDFIVLLSFRSVEEVIRSLMALLH